METKQQKILNLIKKFEDVIEKGQECDGLYKEFEELQKKYFANIIHYRARMDNGEFYIHTKMYEKYEQAEDVYMKKCREGYYGILESVETEANGKLIGRKTVLSNIEERG